MNSSATYLFQDRRFLPTFLVQACGTLNDCIIKNALIILLTYKISNQTGIVGSQFLVLLANAIFILPFVIFASIAGQVADRYERTFIVKIIKFCELWIILLSIYGFHTTNLVVLFVCLFLLGLHSTFFGPIKYSLLPDHLKKSELLSANGFVEAGTFISILIGTILGGCYNANSTLLLSLSIVISIIGYITSYFIPKSCNTNLDIRINYNIIQESITLIQYAKSKKQVYFSILGISWFWFIGAGILAQMPALAKEVFYSNENVANLFIAMFSIGVGFGSFLCTKIFKNEITVQYVFLASLGISVFGIDLFFASKTSATYFDTQNLQGILPFLSIKTNWRIIFDLFGISAISGIYVVPLYTVMQYFSSPTHRSRIVAANNLINSIFTIGSTLILSMLFNWGYTVASVILMLSLLNIVVAFYIYSIIPEVKMLPTKVLRQIAKFLFNIIYDVKVTGLSNFYNAGKRVVVVANHLSYMDPALLAIYLPEDLIFAIDTEQAQKYWIKPFLRIVKALPVDTNNPMAIKTLIQEVRKNRKIAIFPEGRISTTGSLMKIYEGPGMIASKADAAILPIRIDGPQFTHFSKIKDILKTKIFPKITITILPPVKLDTASLEYSSKIQRKISSQTLYDIMVHMLFESSEKNRTIFQSLIDSAKTYGMSKKVIQDFAGHDLSYSDLIFSAFKFATKVKSNHVQYSHVGLMLPNTRDFMIAFYGLQACSFVTAIMDYTWSVSKIIDVCTKTDLKAIYTSKSLFKQEDGVLQDLINSSVQYGIKIICIEDVINSKSTLLSNLSLGLSKLFPQTFYNIAFPELDASSAALILFTKRNAKKAIVISHKNFQSNRYQAIVKMDLNQRDIAFNSIPMSASYSLIYTNIMVLSGIKVCLYSLEANYKMIPEYIYNIGATIMLATDTLLSTISKFAHQYDFYSMRYIFACSEKLNQDTRDTWFSKFGVRILEFYNLTEATTFVSSNTPMHDRYGTVGRFMPHIEYSIKPIDQNPQEGYLSIKGPNLMIQAIDLDTGITQDFHQSKDANKWYDTGDVILLDEDGYVTIICKNID